MFRWLARAYLVLLILSIIDGIVCIVLSNILRNLFYFPSLQDTITLVLSAPQLISTNYMVMNLTLLRAILVLFSMILLIVYIADSSKWAVLYYEATIFVAYITYSLWSILSGVSLSNLLGGTIITQHNVVGLIMLMIIILIYHMPFAVVAGILFSIINRYRIVSSELEVIQGVA